MIGIQDKIMHLMLSDQLILPLISLHLKCIHNANRTREKPQKMIPITTISIIS